MFTLLYFNSLPFEARVSDHGYMFIRVMKQRQSRDMIPDNDLPYESFIGPPLTEPEIQHDFKRLI